MSGATKTRAAKGAKDLRDEEAARIDAENAALATANPQIQPNMATMLKALTATRSIPFEKTESNMTGSAS